jgi:hypothetical protein
MPLICPTAKAKIFFAQGWTGSISLIGFDKSAVWRSRFSANFKIAPNL